MKLAACGLLLLSLVTISGAQEPYPVPEPHPVDSPLLVGSYYFPGHFNAMRWVPMAKFQHPYPLLGYYRDGEPVVSDWHIKWAVEHGIDFFAFDWYYDYKTGNVHEHNLALDRGFLRARYRDLMRFCIFWCNEENWEPDYTEGQMMLLARTLRDRYLHQPNYLLFEGKAALFVSQPSRLIKRFGVEGCAEIWRKMSTEAGVELYPVALQHSSPALKAAGFMATSAYNYAGTAVPPGESRAPYDTMVTGYEETWKAARSDDSLPYIVPVSPGWDSRPWYGEGTMVRTNPRPEKYRQMCEAAKPYVDPRLQAVISECWNEFGEGSYIEPCTQYGFGYLDALRDAFCPDNPHHLDLTPQQMGTAVPVFSEIPVFGEAEVAAQGGNLVYNPGFETQWGWVTYAGGDADLDAAVFHSGARSARIGPERGGMKSWLTIPVGQGDRITVSAWLRTEPGATGELKCALFNGAQTWLQRYVELGSASGPEWQLVSKALTWGDPEADHVDVEVAPRGGSVWVDDVSVTREPAGP
jgi:hypothetical protein